MSCNLLGDSELYEEVRNCSKEVRSIEESLSFHQEEKHDEEMKSLKTSRETKTRKCSPFHTARPHDHNQSDSTHGKTSW